MYMNYGAVGPLIGSTITYGFDFKGRKFDENGNFNIWWQPVTQTAYLEKQRCLIDQYGNYTEPNVNLLLNSFYTLSNDIADNGGIKQAYMAYMQWVATHGEEPRLPGLDYSPNQLFWIAAAQIYCSVYRPGEARRDREKGKIYLATLINFSFLETIKARIQIDVHSPDQFRVLGPLHNMVEFSKSFNCPLGSNMNPAKKCAVW
jgi:neprilysin